MPQSNRHDMTRLQRMGKYPESHRHTPLLLVRDGEMVPTLAALEAGLRDFCSGTKEGFIDMFT